MKRQILVLSGLFVLFLFFASSPSAFATHYKVKSGDTLYSISKKFNVSVNEIKKANNLQKSTIRKNQVLKITSKNERPSSARHSGKPSYYIVKKGDTLSKIVQKTNVPMKQITALNNINPQRIRPGQKLILAKAAPAPRRSTEIIEDQDEDIDGEEDAEEESFFSSVFKNEGQRSDNDFSSDLESRKEFLGKWNSPTETQLLVKVATEFIGAPYRLGGSSVKGLDCSSFVQKIYRIFDVKLPRVAREQSRVGVTIDREELAEGDLVFFHTNRSFGHVGIYIGNDEFVHASSKRKVVRIDSLNSPYYQKRFQRAVRIKTLDG
ncbi:MAG: LysM peptidoglycan-binding domain-containing protein [Smithella sp.]|nr:LysM peptidoglycan-binding domain-containing protein [Smithella sp.]